MEQATTNTSLEMNDLQQAVYETESFLCENYQFRRNLLSGKTEMRALNASDDKWKPITAESMNSIVRHAKKEGVGQKTSPRQNIEEFILSDAIPQYDPILDYLENLPAWDGRDRMLELFSRLPGLTSEQLSWCCTWLRSSVAHWLGMDMLHGNECVPILIGDQGCGKSTFAVRLLPEHLRCYYMDHINFGNKFDSDMALTNNLLVNIDEFANMGTSQQGKLKQTLSKVKVNGRPIFGKSQEDKRRYASFLATTNDEHPLCDPTGSRRFICLRIRRGTLIDNSCLIDYDQLYAQVLYELRVSEIPYWFSTEEVARIQRMNNQFFRTDDLETMLTCCFRLPADDEHGSWMTGNEVLDVLRLNFPHIASKNTSKVKIGKTLRALGCELRHTNKGQAYCLVSIAA